MKFHEMMPNLVKQLCLRHNGWIVGSSTSYFLDTVTTDNKHDWDIVIPLADWPAVMNLIPPGSPANRFGGFKVTLDDDVIDVWAGDVGEVLAQAKTQNFISVAVQPFKNIVLYGERLTG